MHQTIEFEAATVEYDQSIDVFAFAGIMYEVCTCERLYDNMTLIEIQELILSGKRLDFKLPTLYNNHNNHKNNNENNFHLDIINSAVVTIPNNNNNNSSGNDNMPGLKGVPMDILEMLEKLMHSCWSQKANRRPKFKIITQQLLDIIALRDAS